MKSVKKQLEKIEYPTLTIIHSSHTLYSILMKYAGDLIEPVEELKITLEFTLEE